MTKYTHRERELIIAAVQKAKKGLYPFTVWLNNLPESDRLYLKKRFKIEDDDRVKA